jgi:hypothetical protein
MHLLGYGPIYFKIHDSTCWKVLASVKKESLSSTGCRRPNKLGMTKLTLKSTNPEFPQLIVDTFTQDTEGSSYDIRSTSTT